MATLGDIGLAAAINILSALIFLLAFAVLRIQPFNDRIYFPKWYLKHLRRSPTHSGAVVTKFVNLNLKSYLRFLNWIPEALRMPELELIDHAGLDSTVYLQIYILGLKIFVPITFLAWAILVPVNWTNSTLELARVTYSDIDKLSISNIPTRSGRFWAHIVLAYAFTFWTCYVLRKEYEKVASLRLQFLASQRRSPDQFTVIYNANKLAKLVKKRNKKKNWLDYYQLKYSRNQSKRPTTKTGFLGLFGNELDAIGFYESEIERLSKEIAEERERIMDNPNCIMPAAFVSFRTRWDAAVCAQTQQSRDPTKWLTEWAPEPRDVYWQNLAIPFVSLTIRRLIIAAAFFFLTFFFIIPIAFVQSLANLEGFEKAVPFLKPVIEIGFIKSFIQGFLPGIASKIFLILLPRILTFMSKFEGFCSKSSIERRSASIYYVFIFVNIFLGSIATGTAFEQLDSFIHQSADQIHKTIGVAIPMKGTFFITFIMVDGWAGVAGEILRLKPLVFFHLKNMFLVKTERDREKATDPGSLRFNTVEPQIQLYFLVGLVYAAVTPLLLPFILVFFSLAYVVYRHQVINVYSQRYESGGAFWPDVHGRLIAALIISQVLLMGLLSTKEAYRSTPFLIALPFLTIWFHRFCKGRFEPSFTRYPLQVLVAVVLPRCCDKEERCRFILEESSPGSQHSVSGGDYLFKNSQSFSQVLATKQHFSFLLQTDIAWKEEAMAKDTLEQVKEPHLNLKGYLQAAYIHHVFKEGYDSDDDEGGEEFVKQWELESVIVPTKSHSRRNTPAPSRVSDNSSPAVLQEAVPNPPQQP